MEFKPLFFERKLRVVNPHGAIGVVTLWSRIDFILDKLRAAGTDLDPATSRIALLGNLYGEGFRYLLRNLLYNPQIEALLIFGRDKSASSRFVVNFFEKGIEPLDSDVAYVCSTPDIVARPARIVDTNCVMDDLVRPSLFPNPPVIRQIEGIDHGAAEEAASFIAGYRPRNAGGERIYVEAPEVALQSYPSNLRAHTIVEKTPSRAWKLLIHRLFRFGKKVTIRKGDRIELQNVKVVIEEPVFENDEIIRDCGFDPEAFRRYRHDILDPVLPPDSSYTYGNRIRGYFGLDCLREAANSLSKGLDDRGAYLTTWDNGTDIKGPKRPCLATLFFRHIDGVVHLSATFRTHNASDAWLENVYGLLAILEFVAAEIGAATGSITVVSHSISLDPQYLEKAKAVHDEVARTGVFREDPHGYFVITVEEGELALRHHFAGMVIGEYRGSKPEKIQNQLYRDNAISDINHALYIGRQLEKAYRCLLAGEPYTQE